MNVNDYSNKATWPEYLALSHCWGPPERHPITSTTATLEERMTRIPIDQLSNTFRDAVRITRQLGERYLWIDSLCIVQDDKGDWAREAALMADVYGQSSCTLAALSSADSTGGCNLVSDIQVIGPTVEFDAVYQSGEENDEHDAMHPYRPYRTRIFHGDAREWHEEYGDNPCHQDDYSRIDSPLRSRAWTLQERELATRTIHFGKHQLLWECHELKASAQLPWHHKTPRDESKPTPVRKSVTESLESAAMRDRWYGLVEDYTSRSLTRPTDKLPALSGLARVYHKDFDSEYLAGLWSTHLPAALLWRVRYGPGVRTPVYVAPTWSWASITGRITYECQRLAEIGPRNYNYTQERLAEYDFNEPQVTWAQISPMYEDGYGAIKNAYLILGGAKLATIDSSPQLEDFGSEYNQSGLRAELTKDGNTIGLLYPDAKDDMPYIRKLFCLEIRGEPYMPQIHLPHHIYKGTLDVPQMVMGLVLEENQDNENSYRRVGLARWVRKSIFENSQPCSIKLI